MIGGFMMKCNVKADVITLVIFACFLGILWIREQVDSLNLMLDVLGGELL